MKPSSIDLLLADLLLDSVQVEYPNFIGYDRVLRDGHWEIHLTTVDANGDTYYRQSGSHISVFLAAEDAARGFLADQEEPEWAFPPKP